MLAKSFAIRNLEADGLGDRFVVGYSGNLGRAHPIEGLLGAAERLRGHARIHFLFSGF